MKMRGILTAMVAVGLPFAAASAAEAAPYQSAHVSTTSTSTTTASGVCSNAYLDGKYQLGPRSLAKSGEVGQELAGYSRFGGMTEKAFMAKYWDAKAGSWNWPPAPGFVTAPDGKQLEYQITLEPGTLLDRYGSVYGKFLSPAGTPFGERALPPASLDTVQPAYQGKVPPPVNCNYHEYKVDKPVTVEAGPTAPWFGQPGYGMQYLLASGTVGSHLGDGSLSEVTAAG